MGKQQGDYFRSNSRSLGKKEHFGQWCSSRICPNCSDSGSILKVAYIIFLLWVIRKREEARIKANFVMSVRVRSDEI